MKVKLMNITMIIDKMKTTICLPLKKLKGLSKILVILYKTFDFG